MLEPHERVLVAVSGGPDSVCLLHVLHDLGYAVEVAHFDHQTRCGASGEDAAFVRELACSLDIPLHEGSEPVERNAQAAGESFEVYARRTRYAFLARTAAAAGLRAVATGHHADDAAETVLLRLVRGTTPKGLAGIPPVRTDGALRVLRPLIACSREEILAHVHAHEFPYRTDATNADLGVPRNRVRLELVPLLERHYNPNVRDALLRLAEVQRDEDALLDSLARAFLTGCRNDDGSLSRAAFQAGDLALQRRALALFAYEAGVVGDFEAVEAARRLLIDGATGQACDLGEGVLLRNGRDIAAIEDLPPRETGESALTVPGETFVFGRGYRVQLLETCPPEDLRRYCTPRRQVFDAEKMGAPLTVRRRQDGDRFSPLGMRGTVKLKDYFIARGMSRGDRVRQDLLLCDGKIAWVVGHAIDGRYAVTQRTTHLLQVDVD